MSILRRSFALAFLTVILSANPLVSSATPMFSDCYPFGPYTLANTCGFTPFAGLPVEAATAFGDGRWNVLGDAYALIVAEHELLHAVGFTINYALFGQHLDAILSLADRNFYSGTCQGTPRVCTGSVILTLGPSDDGTHADSAVAGQNLDLMQPEILFPFPAGYPNWAVDITALEAAFEWHGLGGIDIAINNLTPSVFRVGELAILAQAEQAVEGFFNAGLTVPPRNAFTWDVFVAAPEPPSLMLVGLGFVVLAALRVRFGRRRPFVS